MRVSLFCSIIGVYPDDHANLMGKICEFCTPITLIRTSMLSTKPWLSIEAVIRVRSCFLPPPFLAGHSCSR
jgi:hypothetical protein